MTDAGEDVEKGELSYSVGGNASWKTAWRFLKKLKIELPYNPAIVLLGIYPKDTNVVIQRGTCTCNVDSNNVHNSQTMERAQMSIDR